MGFYGSLLPLFRICQGYRGGGLKGANSTVYGLPVGVCADWIG